MEHGQNNERQHYRLKQTDLKQSNAHNKDFVLEKSIFSGIFEKDIKRVFIYKKAERLAKAIHLITPAFTSSLSLRERIDAIAIALVDAAIRPPAEARISLSRELLALSSILSIARTTGTLSPMNADLISAEAQSLLQEVANYEEPRLFLEEAPTLSLIAEQTLHRVTAPPTPLREKISPLNKSHIIKDNKIKDRREAVLSVIKDKKRASIKDISTHIRTVSEKTIQRELTALIALGLVSKEGERRWSTYSIA